MGPKWLIIKVVASNECNYNPNAMINWISHVSHHLRSLLGGIELTILCAFVFKVRHFDAQIRET